MTHARSAVALGALLVALVAFSACSDSSTPVVEGRSDTGPGVGLDTGTDVRADAGDDTGDDTSPDADASTGPASVVVTTTSTRADWAPREILNSGEPLSWTVSGPGVDAQTVVADSPSFDLSSNTGEVTVTIESADGFTGVTDFQFDQAGVTGVSNVANLSSATTFALRDNPITVIDVSGLTSIDNLTLRTGQLAEIDLSNLSTLRLLWIYDNELSELDISNNPQLEYVNATGNNLDSDQLDQIVIELDQHGKSNGELFLADNPGSLSEAARTAYQSLVSKGWSIDIPGPVSGVRTVGEWKAMLDAEWADEKSDAVEKATSAGDQQQHYYMFYALEGIIHGWMATGDQALLDDALMLIEATIDTAKPMSGANAGYLGWPSDEARYDAQRAAEGTALWESYLYRMVATLLRVMHQSPNLRATADYQARYDAILEFTKTHIWEKWVQADPTNLGWLYRSRTHMASHWARIAMELYIITGEQQYKDVFDAISFEGMPNRGGESLRSRLVENPADPAAYSLYQEWDNSRVQDTSHGADVISFWVTAIENEMYWGQGANADDAARLVALVDSVIWASNDPLEHTANWDGTGGLSRHDAGFHGSLMVGRFDETFQNRIETYYNPSTAHLSDTHAMGIGAYNRRILDYGRPVYPEFYIPADQ